MEFQGKVSTRDTSFEEALPTAVVGETEKILVSNTDANQLLYGILVELRKIEYHLSIATDTNLNDQDV